MMKPQLAPVLEDLYSFAADKLCWSIAPCPDTQFSHCDLDLISKALKLTMETRSSLTLRYPARHDGAPQPEQLALGEQGRQRLGEGVSHQ